MVETCLCDQVQEAARLGGLYERTCTGCAQSTVAGLLDALGREDDSVFKAASGLADGIGLTGDGSCGALTGACLVIGLFFGRERKDHEDAMAAMRSYLLCRELHQDFVQKYGTCRCHDIQTKLAGRAFDLLNPDDFEAAFQAGMLDRCASVVGTAAEKAAEIIMREANEPKTGDAP